MLTDVVVVGGSLAGVSVARALRELGHRGRVTLVGEEPHRPYDRPPLSKECLVGDPGFDQIELAEPRWYEDNDISLVTGDPAVALDAAAGEVLLASQRTLRFDGLVVATGCVARSMPGADRAAGPMRLRTVDDSRALREVLAGGARSLVVVGASFMGLEVAATAARHGVEVLVVEQAMAPLARELGDDVGRFVVDLHRRNGVEVLCGVAAVHVEGDVGDYRVRLEDGRLLRADAVVTAVGARPRTEWLAGSGVRTGDGVVCDEFCRTSQPGIVAAGDVSRWYNPLFDQQMRVEHWRNAVDQGHAAAETLLGRGRPYAAVPYFWSDQFDLRLRFVGQTYAATAVRIVSRSERSFVVLYGRDGRLTGALCVNATAALAAYRRQIEDRTPWEAAIDPQSAPA